MTTDKPLIFFFTVCLLVLAMAKANDDTYTADFHPEYSADSSNSSYLESLWQAMAETAQEFGAWTMILSVALLDAIPFFPTPPASVVAGAVLGFPLGLPVVMIGQALATALAMWLGRYVWSAQPQAQSADEEQSTLVTNTPRKNTTTKLSRVLDELASGLNSDDWKTVFGTILLARQSPLLPFSLGNYFMGASTKAPIPPVVLATVVGCIPLNCLWVGAGAGGTAAMEAMQEHDSLAKGIQVVGIIASAAIVLLMGRVVYRVCNEEQQQLTTKLQDKEKALRDIC